MYGGFSSLHFCPREKGRFHGSIVIDNSELAYACLELNSRHLEEKSLILTAEPCLQSLIQSHTLIINESQKAESLEM